MIASYCNYMHLTDVMCNRNISTKLTKQSVQDSYKTSHGVSWCRMLGSSKEKEEMKLSLSRSAVHGQQ